MPLYRAPASPTAPPAPPVPLPVVSVITTNSATADTAAIQAAITANPGALIWVHGNVTLSDTLTINTNHTSLSGDGTWSVNFTNKPMIKVLNAAYNQVGSGIFFDANWATGVTAIQGVGALLGEYHVIGDRLMVGIGLDCNDAAATQNSSMNQLWATIRNGATGISFKGKSGQHASNNVIRRLEWWASASVSTSVAVDFMQYADNNITDWAYIHLTASGHTGFIYNSASPTTDVEVYENHVRFAIVESDTAGTTAVKGNRTWQSIGSWTSNITLRLSGASTPAMTVAANSDLRLIRSNLNGSVVDDRWYNKIDRPSPTVKMTQAAYTALGASVDNNTLYLIVG